MTQRRTGESGAMSLSHMENSAANLIEIGTSAITMPLEQGLRFFHGTRYFSAPVTFGAALLMMGLPLLSMLLTDVQNMMPFSHPAQTVGMFGLASLSKFFFFMYAVHAVRLRKLTLHMHLEKNSYFEGPALPFFQFIPWCQTFWKIRLVAEPVFVLLLSIVLQDFLIIQTGLAYYLRFAAVCLVMKNYLVWRKDWTYVRDLMDAQSAMPTLNNLVENRATEDELAVFHLAGFPKDIPDTLRVEAANRIVRDYASND
jgi:hypothetical protein